MDTLKSFVGTSSDPFVLAEEFYAYMKEDPARGSAYFHELSANDGVRCDSAAGELLMLGSNNYLALTADPYVRQKAMEALASEGPSMTGSRFLNGTTRAHTLLEQALARFLGREAGLVFTTGYQANVGLISALCNAKTTLILDRACHASIVDGARMAGCRVVRFHHNEPEHLRKILASLSSETSPLVMVDGVYSMEGDVAPIPEIHALCREFGAKFIIDDAHGIGTMGATGRGVEEHFELLGCADAITGTFSKSLASIGGFVVASRQLIEWIRYNARSLIFSASLPPPLVAAAHAALTRLEEEPSRVAKLRENVKYWRTGLNRRGLKVIPAETPVVAIHIGDAFECVALGSYLREQGVFVNAAIPPAVPEGHALLRTSVTAAHTQDVLDNALRIMEQAFRHLRAPANSRHVGAVS